METKKRCGNCKWKFNEDVCYKWSSDGEICDKWEKKPINLKLESVDGLKFNFKEV